MDCSIYKTSVLDKVMSSVIQLSAKTLSSSIQQVFYCLHDLRNETTKGLQELEDPRLFFVNKTCKEMIRAHEFVCSMLRGWASNTQVKDIDWAKQMISIYMLTFQKLLECSTYLTNSKVFDFYKPYYDRMVREFESLPEKHSGTTHLVDKLPALMPKCQANE
jgi:hypothetical protein